MTAQEKREQNVLKRSKRTVAQIDKELNNLDKARDKVSFESAEHCILTTAIDNLGYAKDQLEILIRRITNK